jgi:hypothetical protein
MSDGPIASGQKEKKKSFLSFLAWWQTDPEEVKKQVAEYHTLKVWQSARGISLLLCLFTIAVTALLSKFVGLTTDTVIGEAVIWSILGFFMYRGHRWAFVGAMLLWTLEKATLLVTGGSSPIVQVIWWAVFMNAFMLGFRVERGRKAALAVAPA